jgi:hypothetical protein
MAEPSLRFLRGRIHAIQRFDNVRHAPRGMHPTVIDIGKIDRAICTLLFALEADDHARIDGEKVAIAPLGSTATLPAALPTLGGITSRSIICRATAPISIPSNDSGYVSKADFFSDFIAKSTNELTQRLCHALTSFMNDPQKVASQCSFRK